MISIVIPALNEKKALPATLEHIAAQQEDMEIIIVDGGSIDVTYKCIDKYKNIKLIIAPRGRASQMNAGANIAKGEWLLFLHADALLPEMALFLIQQQVKPAGGFRHKFSGDAWGLRVVSWMHNLRCKLTGVFYGDQAMFIRRSLFVKLGGFPNVAHLEDLLFSEKLLKHTQPILLPLEVISDSRKFEQQGIWLSLLRVIQIQLCHELKLDPPTQKFFESIR